MNPDERIPEGFEPEPDETEPPRSVFAALWFRVLLVVVVVGVVAAVAVPYVLDWMSPPSPKATTAPAPFTPAAPAPVAPQPAPTAPATPTVVPPPAAGQAQESQPVVSEPAKTPVPVAGETPGKAPAARRSQKEPARTPAPAAAKAPAATGGTFFVQVGAFKDPQHAKSVATRLREAKFRVDESPTVGQGRSAAPAPSPAAQAGGAGDKYDVFVSGGSIAEVNAKLAAKGLATETAGTGVVVKPSLPLRDAVALSKDLAVAGLKVQVRRAASSAGAAPTPAPSREPPGGGETLHRVRVGPFPDRAAAIEALNALKEKGYKDSFIARGGA